MSNLLFKTTYKITGKGFGGKWSAGDIEEADYKEEEIVVVHGKEEGQRNKRWGCRAGGHSSVDKLGACKQREEGRLASDYDTTESTDCIVAGEDWLIESRWD